MLERLKIIVFENFSNLTRLIEADFLSKHKYKVIIFYLDK